MPDDDLTVKLDRIASELRTFGASDEDESRLLKALRAVLKAHQPADRGRVMRCCEGCEMVNGEFHEDCCHEWPCPTYLAITREITRAQLGAQSEASTEEERCP